MIKAHWQVRATHFHACTYAWVCVCVWLMARIIVTDTKGHYWYNRQRISCEGQCGNTKSQDLQQKTSGSTIGDNFISAQILSLSVYMYPCERICYAVVYSAALSYAILCNAVQCNAMLRDLVCVCVQACLHMYTCIWHEYECVCMWVWVCSWTCICKAVCVWSWKWICTGTHI